MANANKCLDCPRCGSAVKAYAEPFGMRAGPHGRSQAYGAECSNHRCAAKNEFVRWFVDNKKNAPIPTAGGARRRWNEWAETIEEEKFSQSRGRGHSYAGF